MKKVDFLVIGMQKSGTTALDHYLRQHNDIVLPKEKELHFFDNDEIFTGSLPEAYEKYHQHFPSNVDAHQKIGEITPIYSYWDSAVRRIWEYNPKIKLIVILRNPIERAYSHWNMEYNKGKDKLPFDEAISLEMGRSKEVLPLKHRVYSYIDRGFYSEQLRLVYRFFDKKQLLILRYEDLLNRYQNELNRVTDFLSIKRLKFVELEGVHRGKYAKKLPLQEYRFLKNIFLPEIKTLEQQLGWDCRSWYSRKEKFKVLFYRNFEGYTGGHQKVYDYYKQLKEHPSFDVEIFFSPTTRWNQSNPWMGEYRHIVQELDFDNYDILFIAGLDWEIVPSGLEDKKTLNRRRPTLPRSYM